MAYPKKMRIGIFNRLVNGGEGMGGAPLPLWTFGYNGVDSFGELDNAWNPTGVDWSIIITGFDGGQTLDGAGDRYLLSNATSYHAQLQIRVGSNGDVTSINLGSPTDLGNTGLTKFSITTDGDVGAYSASSSSKTVLGAHHTAVANFKGQITSVQFIDNDSPSNSITINNFIASATQPTNFNIYNELTGAAIGEYKNGVYELVEA